MWAISEWGRQSARPPVIISITDRWLTKCRVHVTYVCSVYVCAHVVAEGKGIWQAGTQRCIGRSFEGWVNLKLLQLPRKFPYHHPSFWSFCLVHPFSEKQFATQAHSSWVYGSICMYINIVLASVCNGGVVGILFPPVYVYRYMALCLHVFGVHYVHGFEVWGGALGLMMKLEKRTLRF